MPKNRALLNEIEAVLQIYYDAGGWLDNGVYKEKLKLLIGSEQYSSSYTKKAQITSYFGFTTWEDVNNPRSVRRITESGKLMYEAIKNNDAFEIQNVIMRAFETVKFGRNNCGCPESDSDIEPPSLFIRAAIDLGYLTYKEFAYLLWKLEDVGGNYTECLRDIQRYRNDGNLVLNQEAQKYTDAKPIMILVRWGFLTEEEDASESRQKHIRVNSSVMQRFSARLKNLKIYNIDMDCSDIKNKGRDESMTETKTCFDVKRKRRNNDFPLPLNFIIYGAPGTGKTYSTPEYALAIMDKRPVDLRRKSCEEREKVMTAYKDYVQEGRIVFTTFHQSYGYEEFIQGLRPDTESEKFAFKTVDGVFKRIADNALIDDENNYVIIIDEINRANISKVFGELITLIENDKRWGEVNETCAMLPSGKPFAVPNNLYIIGTMNSADKSISLIDAALRRRFKFIEQYPDPMLIDDVTLRNIFNKINTILADSLESSDLLIGHSYFMDKTADDLCEILNSSIIPLLYEYYYDDRKKVIGVLKEAIEGMNIKIVDAKISRVRVEKVDAQG